MTAYYNETDPARRPDIEAEADRLGPKSGGSAFPNQPLGRDGLPVMEMWPGMTLRDWFAGQALAGLYASEPHDCDQHGMAHDAYLAADAMLKAREGMSDD